MVVSGSVFLYEAPKIDDGDEFLDCWLGVGASEPSLDEAGVVVGRAGLSACAAPGWVLGAMAYVTLDAVVLRGHGRKDQGNEAPTLRPQSAPGKEGRGE